MVASTEQGTAKTFNSYTGWTLQKIIENVIRTTQGGEHGDLYRPELGASALTATSHRQRLQ